MKRYIKYALLFFLGFFCLGLTHAFAQKVEVQNAKADKAIAVKETQTDSIRLIQDQQILAPSKSKYAEPVPVQEVQKVLLPTHTQTKAIRKEE